MNTYIFKAVLEPADNRWSAYRLTRVADGASTWGDRRRVVPGVSQFQTRTPGITVGKLLATGKGAV